MLLCALCIMSRSTTDVSSCTQLRHYLPPGPKSTTARTRGRSLAARGTSSPKSSWAPAPGHRPSSTGRTAICTHTIKVYAKLKSAKGATCNPQTTGLGSWQQSRRKGLSDSEIKGSRRFKLTLLWWGKVTSGQATTYGYDAAVDREIAVVRSCLRGPGRVELEQRVRRPD